MLNDNQITYSSITENAVPSIHCTSSSSSHRCQSFSSVFPGLNRFWLFNPRSIVEMLAQGKLIPIFSPQTSKISGLHWQTIQSKFRKDILRAGNPLSGRKKKSERQTILKSNGFYIKNKCFRLLKSFHYLAHSSYLKVILNRFQPTLQTQISSHSPSCPKRPFHRQANINSNKIHFFHHFTPQKTDTDFPR